MNILIYGAGSVGISFGTALVYAGACVSILARGEAAKLIASDGMGFYGVAGTRHAHPRQFRLVESLAAALTQPYDAILCCTKLANLDAWKPDILALAAANRDARIVFMQNGWGINAHFEGVVAPERIANAAIHLGITRSSLNITHINSAGDPSAIGRIGIQEHDQVIDTIVQGIGAGGISCRFASDIGSALWEKMLYNCTTNAPSYLLNVANGGLGGDDGRILLGLLINEIYAVICALGYQPPLATADQFTELMVGTLLPMSAEHVSSMLQDRRQGKPTEIEFMNGAVVRVADQHRIPCTANKVIYQLVKMMERNHQTS